MGRCGKNSAFTTPPSNLSVSNAKSRTVVARQRKLTNTTTLATITHTPTRTKAFSLLVPTEQPISTRLFLKKSRTLPHSPVQSRSENALNVGCPVHGCRQARYVQVGYVQECFVVGD